MQIDQDGWLRAPRPARSQFPYFHSLGRSEALGEGSERTPAFTHSTEEQLELPL